MPDTVPILIEISPGELFDKITILTIKQSQIKELNKLKNIQFEFKRLQQARNAIIKGTTEKLLNKLLQLEQSLKEVNEQLWGIEDNIRECERNQNFDKTFIELARSVYFTNDRRSNIKRQINELLDAELIEEKSYQSY